MRTYLNSLTVKTLNIIAKQMGLKGYSKLRKADLIAALMTSIEIDHMEAVKINNERDTETVESAIMNELATIATEAPKMVVTPVAFSHTPTKPAESDAEPVSAPTEDVPSLQDLKNAYRSMRATANKLGNVPARIRIVGKLRTLSAQLKAAGIKNPQYL